MSIKYILIALATEFITPLSWAQAPQPSQVEMVVIPRELVVADADWIASPNATTAVKLYSLTLACLNDNPHNGMLARTGQDRCQPVTKALAERDEEITNLKKQVTDLLAKLDSSRSGK